jgi:MFS-type transporter involved in bile tolerance (Atg22 family)
MVADAVTFAVAASALIVVVRPRYRLHGDVREPWLRSLGGGIAYLRRDRTALVFLLALCGLNVFASPITGIGVPLRISDAGWPALTLGVAEAALSVCAIAGSLAAIRLKPAKPATAAFIALIVQGLAYALVAIPTVPTLIAAMALIGLTAGCASVWLSALFVRVVAPAYLGRAASLSNLGDLLLVPAALPLFGVVTAHVGIGISPVIIAALMVAMCGGILIRRDIRGIGAATRNAEPDPSRSAVRQAQS